MTMKRFFFLITISLFPAFLFSSCLTARVGGSKGIERYELRRSLTMPNHWETVVKRDVKAVYDAAVAGSRDLGLNTRNQKVDALSGIIEGLFADGTDFRIILSYEAPERTAVLIKVGLTGDKNRSLQLFKSMEKNF